MIEPTLAYDDGVGAVHVVGGVFIIIGLIAGVVQGVFAYTGRWQNWYYSGSSGYGVAPPITIFWGSVMGLLLWAGVLVHTLGAESISIIFFFLAMPPALLSWLSYWWVPPFARPRWIAREEALLEARLLAKRDRPPQDGD